VRRGLIVCHYLRCRRVGGYRAACVIASWTDVPTGTRRTTLATAPTANFRIRAWHMQRGGSRNYVRWFPFPYLLSFLPFSLSFLPFPCPLFYLLFFRLSSRSFTPFLFRLGEPSHKKGRHLRGGGKAQAKNNVQCKTTHTRRHILACKTSSVPL